MTTELEILYKKMLRQPLLASIEGNYMLRFKRVPMQLQQEILTQVEENNEAIIKSLPNFLRKKMKDKNQREVVQSGKQIIIKELTAETSPSIRKRQIGQKMKNKK
jgi:hypothetical protein